MRETRSSRKKPEQKPWRNTLAGFRSMVCSADFSYITQNHYLLRVGTRYSGLGPPTSTINQENANIDTPNLGRTQKEWGGVTVAKG